MIPIWSDFSIPYLLTFLNLVLQPRRQHHRESRFKITPRESSPVLKTPRFLAWFLLPPESFLHLPVKCHHHQVLVGAIRVIPLQYEIGTIPMVVLGARFSQYSTTTLCLKYKRNTEHWNVVTRLNHSKFH